MKADHCKQQHPWETKNVFPDFFSLNCSSHSKHKQDSPFGVTSIKITLSSEWHDNILNSPPLSLTRKHLAHLSLKGRMNSIESSNRDYIVRLNPQAMSTYLISRSFQFVEHEWISSYLPNLKCNSVGQGLSRWYINIHGRNLENYYFSFSPNLCYGVSLDMEFKKLKKTFDIIKYIQK